MKINILIFGQLVDIVGNRSMVMDDIQDTETLKDRLQRSYPRLNALPYLIAVEKEVVQGNTLLSDHATVALLPPYAGG